MVKQTLKVMTNISPLIREMYWEAGILCGNNTFLSSDIYIYFSMMTTLVSFV